MRSLKRSATTGIPIIKPILYGTKVSTSISSFTVSPVVEQIASNTYVITRHQRTAVAR